MSTEINKFNLDRTQAAINFADSKAAFFLGLTLAFLSAWSALVPRVVEMVVSSSHEATPLWVTLSLCGTYVIFAGLSLVSLWQLLLVVTPRLVPKADIAAGYTSSFYFDAIASETAESFVAQMATISEEAVARGLAEQTHRSARIATAKFQHLQTAIRWMKAAGSAGLIFAGLAVVLPTIFHPSQPTCVVRTP